MEDIFLDKMNSSPDAVGFQDVKLMKKCDRCRNKLSFIGRYIHPIIGKKYIICGSCYTKLDKIIEQWRNFVFTHPDIIKSINIDYKIIKNNFESTVTSIMKTYGYVISEEHSIDYQKNIPEHTITNDTKQELFHENILQSMNI